MSSITFSSCFYIVKSKSDPEVYIQWMDHFMSIVNPNFNLVIYTDAHTREYINDGGRPNIKVVVKPMAQFYNMKYKKDWEKNHKKNTLLNEMTHWKLNMLWSEKLAFVKETIEKQYFNTEWHGWCDIGYFRNRAQLDTPLSELSNWPSPSVIAALDPAKVVYGIINNDEAVVQGLFAQLKRRNAQGLPEQPLSPSQTSVSGGFFMVHRDKMAWWFSTYDAMLSLYFKHEYLVKDDQMVLIDCIVQNREHFALQREVGKPYDNWFMFQRILMPPQAPPQPVPVSILMPVYNGVEYMNESVKSVLAQTSAAWELLIGVNGHEPNSDVYVAAKVWEARSGGRIRALELYPVRGKSNALNVMLSYCRYDWVALLDVDDAWMPNKLELQMQKWLTDQYDVLGTKCVYFGDTSYSNVVPSIPVHDISQADFAVSNPIINSSCAVRKELCRWDGEWDGVEDYDMWLRLRKEGRRFYNLQEVLVRHRLHPNSAFNAQGNALRGQDLLVKHGYLAKPA